MRKSLPTVATAIVGLSLLASPAAGQQGYSMGMHTVAKADLVWSDIEVPGFLPGVKLAGIHGDPAVADEPYTLRLIFPDGYKFPPHYHPRAENVTVLEGTLTLAMGRQFDESKLKSYGPGDYLFIEAENPHFGSAKGRTVIQLHGVGPFEILVVEGQGMTR